MNKYIRYILPAVFLSSIFLIVFLQFNSNEAIHELMDGNNDLQNVYKVKSDFQRLINNMLSVDARVKTAVIKGQSVDSTLIDFENKHINIFFDELNRLANNAYLSKPIEELKLLIEKKLTFNKNTLSILNSIGKDSAEAIINSNTENLLIDSIRSKTNHISKLYETNAANIILKANADGSKAKTFSLLIAIVAAVACLFVFAFISFKIREQNNLIAKLNISENKARELARIKDQFLSNMSHEIRTPLNAILGFTGLLQNKKMDKESSQFVNNIHTSGENLLNIVNDILDLSKIQAGVFRIEKENFEIRKIIQDLYEIFILKTKAKNISFCLTVDDSVPNWIYGDRFRLIQVLTNIVNNAVKFTSTGGITLLVKKINQDKQAALLEFTIADTGIGIAENEITKIFDRFHQADEALTRKYGGTGLGLAIVKNIIEQQGGVITVKSVLSKGTTFTFQINYDLSENNIIQKDNSENTQPKINNEKYNILVAEDNLLNSTLIKHLLNNHHFNSTHCENGKEIINLLKKQNFDLLLLDIQMPEMDGYTTAGIIRNELQLSIPIIGLTAHALEGENEKCLTAGMNAYLSKPINEKKLIHTIQQLIQAKTDFISKDVNNQLLFHQLGLGYLKEISQGDETYEKSMVELFISELPKAFQKLKTQFDNGQILSIREAAHDMKNTVAVLELHTATQLLNRLEYEDYNEQIFSDILVRLQSICQQALEEARTYLQNNLKPSV